MECAIRLSNYLCTISSIEPSLQQWLTKTSRPARSATPIDLSATGIYSLLKTNNRDVGRDPILELGFNISLWNGQRVSVGATVGAFSADIENALVLSFHGDCAFDRATWRSLLLAAVNSFDADSAVVTSHDYIETHESDNDELVGWITYARNEAIVEKELS